MITADQIKTIARKKKIAVGVVEKDYALTWLLCGLYSKNSRLKESFVLKGGTAIRKAYFPGTWRFSEDLDFTVIGRSNNDNNKDGPDKIRESVQQTLDLLLLESGIAYSLETFHANEGVIIANVRFRGPLNYINKIKHDISLHEQMVLKPVYRGVKSDYPDLPEFKILAYSLDEILAEKTRSIMQRGYSRDYFDVWKLLKEDERKLDKSKIKKLLVEKCKLNQIDYKPTLLFSRIRIGEARSHWTVGLGHLMKEIPDFDRVISDLKIMLNFLKE